MQLLTDYLNKNYNFTTAQWEKFFQNDRNRLGDLLNGMPIFTGHSERHDPLLYETISLKPVREIRVNCGGVETSMEQFLYSKFGLSIQKPNYCCLVNRNGPLGLDSYYPLEFVYVDKK